MIDLKWLTIDLTETENEEELTKGKKYFLYRLLHRIQKPLTDNPAILSLNTFDIGLAYTQITLNLPFSEYLSRLEYSQDEDTKKRFKKRFQETTRIRLYQLIHELETKETPFSEISKSYLEEIATGREKLERHQFQLKEGTIEKEVERLVFPKGNYQLIGASVLEGAEEYFKQQRKEALFKEYNCILEAMKSKNG